jgi:hypothetical protein
VACADSAAVAAASEAYSSIRSPVICAEPSTPVRFGRAVAAPVGARPTPDTTRVVVEPVMS